MLIGALAETTGVTAKTVRFWEAEGLLHPPARTAGGWRTKGSGRLGDRLAGVARVGRSGNGPTRTLSCSFLPFSPQGQSTMGAPALQR